jgi:biotin carboxyl carrier protein
MTGDGALTHTVLAPFAGVVVALPHGSDEEVVADTPVVVLEAMKMELAVQAPAAGVVRAVHVRPGDVVSAGQALIEMED